MRDRTEIISIWTERDLLNNLGELGGKLFRCRLLCDSESGKAGEGKEKNAELHC